MLGTCVGVCFGRLASSCERMQDELTALTQRQQPKELETGMHGLQREVNTSMRGLKRDLSSELRRGMSDLKSDVRWQISPTHRA